MKSGKQRRLELQAKKAARKEALAQAAQRAAKQKAERERIKHGGVAVNRNALAPTNSYCPPEFIERGYYLDLKFTCTDCGTEEYWTATQQKWWYEVAKGDVFTTARRCRPCRRRERERRDEARRVSAEGIARKQSRLSTNGAQC
jgi:hypothetical protein